MLLAVDVGNTQIKLGIFHSDSLIFNARLSTDRLKTSDEYAIEINTLFLIHNIDAKSISGIIISSVVPSVTLPLKKSLETLTSVTALVIGKDIESGLNIAIDNPSTLGADLAVSCVAAKENFNCPCIVIGMGTATTFSVLNKNGEMCGGAIMPGVAISLDALVHGSSLLPSIGLTEPNKVIGKNTETCMRSGIVIGTACMVDGMCERIEKELNEKCTVIAYGGLANVIIPSCKRNITICDNIMMEGLRIIYENYLNNNLKPEKQSL